MMSIRSARRRSLARLAALAIGGAVPAAVPARAQAPAGASVAGVVLDAQTGEPVASARTRLAELHREDLSHQDGTFALRALPAGVFTLVVQRIGYRPLTRSVEVKSGETVELRLALQPTALELKPQVVTGTLSERPGEEMLSPTSVLSGSALDRRAGETVATTLRDEPGVAVTSIGPATARPVIRGLGGDRILVLEDGQRPGDLSSTSGDHAVAIDPLTARQIEVVRGPMSLLYGSSALGGVVNVVRDEIPTSLPEHASGVLSVQGQSVNRGATGGGYVTGRLGRFAMRAEGSARNSADIRTPVGDLVNTDSRAYNASIGAAYVRDGGYGGASYRFQDTEYGIPGGFVGAHPTGVDITTRRHTGRIGGELHLPRPFMSVRGAGVLTDYRLRELEQSGEVGTAFDQTVLGGDVLARHDTLGLIALGAFGLRAQYRAITTGGSLRTPSTDDYNFAAYVVEEMGRGALRLQVGARYDYARYVPRERGSYVFVGGRRVPVRPRTFGALSGSAGLLVALPEGLRLGASVSRAYRTPDFNELYSNGPHLAANAFEVGDPDLRRETGVGLDAFVRIARVRLHGEIAVFHNRLADFISPSSRGRAEISPQGRPLFQYTNTDAAFTGGEAEAELGLTRSVAVEGTVSFVRARYTEERPPIPVFTPNETGGVDTSFVPASRVPALIPPLNGRVEVRFDRQRVFAGAGARFAARQDRLGDFEEPTARYGIADLWAGYRLLAGSRVHTLTLRVDNLLDREYREHLSRVKAIMPEPGRNVSVLYRLTF